MPRANSGTGEAREWMGPVDGRLCGVHCRDPGFPSE